jgi:hypothetical protein
VGHAPDELACPARSVPRFFDHCSCRRGRTLNGRFHGSGINLKTTAAASSGSLIAEATLKTGGEGIARRDLSRHLFRLSVREDDLLMGVEDDPRRVALDGVAVDPGAQLSATTAAEPADAGAVEAEAQTAKNWPSV